jgi:hypothetical protein
MNLPPLVKVQYAVASTANRQTAHRDLGLHDLRGTFSHRSGDVMNTPTSSPCASASLTSRISVGIKIAMHAKNSRRGDLHWHTFKLQNARPRDM